MASDELIRNISNITTNIFGAGKQMHFSWYDYVFFGVMLLVSALIGIYFGCFGTKQSTPTEYLLGGKKMKVIPIVLSLIASHVSGITILAVPANVYRFGAAYGLLSISVYIIALITLFIYLPVFYNLQLTSTYEYLELRFDQKTRMLASFLFALSLLLYLPIVIYVPALAFSAATGINIHVITPVVCGVCIFYTAIGGLKAVVWTDALQFSVTLGALVTVFTLGIRSAGGFGEVFKKAAEGDRLNMFDFDPDPTKRDTFWTVLIGMTFSWSQYFCINQSCVQKFLALPTLKDAKKAVVFACIGLSSVIGTSVITGLIMYAKYSDCDPFTTGAVEKNDQLLPYYVMDVAGHIPGLSGLFIAGIFCAALSTLSANLNCLTGTIYEDFVSKCIKKQDDAATNFTLKLIVVLLGIISTLLVYVVEKFGSILSLAWSLAGITDGCLLALFTLGVLFTRTNAKGAFYGTCIGLAFMTYMVSTVQYYRHQNILVYPPKPTSVMGCDNFIYGNDTRILYVAVKDDPDTSSKETYQPFILFRLSFYYFIMIGCLVSVVSGLIISYLTNKNDPEVNKDLIAPIVHFLLPKRKTKKEAIVYYDVQEALKIVTDENGT